MKLGHEIKFLQ